jgi:hypothetical protein
MVTIQKIIIWGHKLHSHTHGYVHNGFYLGFKKLGYDTYWFDDDTNVDNFDFSNSLFLSEHQVDFKIPQRSDCLYFIHFLEEDRYQNVPRENLINMKCAFRDMTRERRIDPNLVYTPVDEKKFEFYMKDKNDIINYYILWATDIFSEDIDENIKNLEEIHKNINHKIIYFIGTMTEPWRIMYNFLYRSDIRFIQYGATFDKNSHNNKSILENMKLIQSSLVSPAFQEQLQIDDTYIPCRIFKNISYGRMGITNSYFTNDFFDKRLIYDSDIIKCTQKAIEFEKREDKLEIIKSLMNYVKDNHTYVNRVETFINFINKHTLFKIVK